MDTASRVLVSAPKLKHLSPLQQKLLDSLVRKITAEGFRAIDVDGAARLEDQVREIRKLQGVVVVAFAQCDAERLGRKSRKKAIFPTEFNHLHIAIASAAHIPLLQLREKCVTERGAFRPAFGLRRVRMPSNLDPAYLASRDFEKQFESWVNEVRTQCHVFFGYSGKARDTANRIHLWLQNSGLKVLDWNNFRPAESIFSRIEQAADRVACGLFLLTADDVKIKNNQLVSGPRDNVIFEAGYFARAKGKERTLIILEEGVDLLTDLGGDIYLSLGKERDPTMIEGKLTRYFEAILNEHLPYGDK